MSSPRIVVLCRCSKYAWIRAAAWITPLFSAFPATTPHHLLLHTWLSRLLMLTIDDNVCRHVWNGKIPIQITLDPVEAAGKETEPIFVMLDTILPAPLYQVHCCRLLIVWSIDWSVTVLISANDNTRDILHIYWVRRGNERQREQPRG